MTARITVTGNAVTDPLVRVTRTGRKVANFRIGSTERYLDRASGEWTDGNSFYVSVACWNALADNVEVSVKLGMALVVTGRISQRTWTDSNDKTQFAYEIQAESVAPDLNRGTVEFTKVSRTSGPPVGLGADGETMVGLAEAPFEKVGSPGHRPDEYVVHPDGSFGSSAGVTFDGDEDGGGAGEAGREPSELVGATR